MQNIIVGTAGHVDHGKTCLIKALSGFDTDRLKEEKKRGITIDLGFANLPNDAGLHIGIIDVPGHEKFVKNMLAGIGGIDLVLMVVALDEGVMPQTTEHFEILKMLHIRRGILVLTKCDIVDEEWAGLVEADVEDMVKDSFLEGAPVVRVSSYTGENIPQLRDMIIRMVSDLGARREEAELFRLPVDRVFSMEGFGTVVTGTLQEGTVTAGQEVMLYPRERLVKIRGIQSHGKREEAAAAGQRTALNLQGIKKEEIRRGDVLAYPGSLVRSILADVKLSVFQTSGRELKSGDRVHFNYGSAQAIAKAVLLDAERIGPGESAYAQLRFDEPIVLKRDDRFIIPGGDVWRRDCAGRGPCAPQARGIAGPGSPEGEGARDGAGGAGADGPGNQLAVPAGKPVGHGHEPFPGAGGVSDRKAEGGQAHSHTGRRLGDSYGLLE